MTTSDSPESTETPPIVRLKAFSDGAKSSSKPGMTSLIRVIVAKL